MTLKVIGAGFGRTGTASLYQALNQVGFPCYHMFEVIDNKANKSHLDFWNKVANGEEGQQHDWDQVFAKYTATVDNPACCVWQELLVKNPAAKIILTLHPRGADAWYESTIDTIYFTEKLWQFKLLKLLTPFARKLGNISTKLIWGRSHKGTMEDRDKALAHYHQHIENIKAKVPAEQLLIYSVDQGWEPLCNFLGIPVPATEFPNVNDRAEVKKTIKGIMTGGYILLAVIAVLFFGISYALIELFT